MASFLPSFFQKRLLRYALSRLELVDTDALDLDSLGIRWGQRSTFELREIGLKLSKLASILRLPATCELLKARISLLRVTIPADIYNSGIVVEAEGIKVHIRLLPEAGPEDVQQPGSHKEGRPSADGPDADRILPTTTDLAQSFLESEPREEKAELQAAISSQSQYLQRSSTSLSDDEEELGLGNEGVSLPSFVAAFLKGVADRLQIKVKNVSVRVDMDLRQDGPVKRHPEEKPDPVSVLLSVQELSIDGVSHPGSETPSLKAGGRLVSLSTIHAMLVSDPVVFSNYSRFAVPPPSPSTTHSKVSQAPSRVDSPPPPPSPSPPPPQRPPSSGSGSVHDLTRSIILDRSHHAEDQEDSHARPLEESVYTFSGRFSDAGTEAEYGSESYLHGQDVSEGRYDDDDNLLDSPAYLDEVFHSQLAEDIEDSTTLPPQLSPHSRDTPRPQSPRYDSSELTKTQHDLGNSRPLISLTGEHHDSGHSLPGGPSEGNKYERVGSPKAGYRAQSPAKSTVSHHGDLDESDRQTIDTPATGSSNSSSHCDDDLTESKLFSHEEAESMYMSAISHTSRSYTADMPGAWGSSSFSRSRREPYSPEPTSAVQSATMPDTHVAEEHMETGASTPKLTAQDGSRTANEGILGNSQSSLRNSQSSFDLQQREPEESGPNSLSGSLHGDPEVARKVVDINKITIWIPSDVPSDEAEAVDTSSHGQRSRPVSRDMKASTASLSASVMGDSIGASKLDLSRRFRRDSTASSIAFEGPEPRSPTLLESQAMDPQSKKHSDSIVIDVDDVSIQFDIATGWLLVKVGQKVLSVYGGDSEQKRSGTTHPAAVQTSQKVSFNLGNCSVRFLEHLTGFPYHGQNTGSLFSHSNFSSVEDVILQATISGLKSRLSIVNDVTKFQLDLAKFVFGFAYDDFLSFNEELKMRESTRDVLSPIHSDISLSVIKSAGSATANLTTLPVHLNLNIQRLEETLGWFGGLSTILELGNSMASVSTVREGRPEVSNKSSRGVHFEGVPAARPTAPTTGSVPWKLNARFGGSVIDLVGESCSMRLKTTAIKIVSRSEGVGVQIDKAKLNGPFLLGDSSDSPAKINLGNIRIEYLFSPKEVDLDRLLSLITPSKDKYEEDDDIMLDTLIRQRRQGAVLRITVAAAKLVISSVDELGPLSHLLNELGKLSTVAKYLPEDDRPGILTLALVRELEGQFHIGGKVGDLSLISNDLEVAHVSIPSLVAAQIRRIALTRNNVEELIGEALQLPGAENPARSPLPMIMARFIADEMDPTSSSVANLTDLHTSQLKGTFPGDPEGTKPDSMPSKLTVALRDCVLGLNPHGMPAKGLVILTYARFAGEIHEDEPSEATFDVKKATVMIIDDVQNIGSVDNPHRRSLAAGQSEQVQAFADMGFVPVSFISSALAVVKVVQLADDGKRSLDVELRDDLLILETCADSTQTLINLLNGLMPPTPPSTALKYRTEIMPIQDMLASFSGDAFATDREPDTEDSAGSTHEQLAHGMEDNIDNELEYVSDFYPEKPDYPGDALSGSMAGSTSEKNLLDSFHSEYNVSSSISGLDFQDDHFAKKSSVGGTAHRWDSTHNTYGLANDVKLHGSPLRVRVRDVHFIWNLFDGYDWRRTRDTISKAVKNVEMKATERRARAASRLSPAEEEEESVIGDFLFNSIYIGIPANKEPRELSHEINRNIDDLASETGSYATSTTVTGLTSRQSQSPSVRGKKLRLSRSKHHKMTFELKGICADLVVFPPDSGETQSSLDVRVHDLEIFDHIPTSTWKKFATYMYDAGERESGTSMVHLEVLNVKPVADLAASEIVLKATILPLRLHVDQDALDFLSRFFEFKDESAPAPNAPGDVPFLQRVEVNAIRVKLDFKPKRVDYAGLRSGRTTEFMNFFVLDEADMVLRHVIIYGVSGFDKLGQTLNDIWMPDIKRNQLPGVLAGLAPIRSLVNVGSGVKDLVVIPMREYKKDGRIVRSIQKGAVAFAKTTTNELVKLGAKLAIGTQTVLQGAEEFLTSSSEQQGHPISGDGLEDDLADEEEKKQISLYADQPVGVVQGLRGACASLERDLLMARDAIVAVPGEVMESVSAAGAAKAVWRRAPTVILRPAIGATKAVGQTLLGAGNTLDPSNRRKIEDKYKRH
ncbi:Autophagy regulatory protein Atg2 [Rasamsonia emersonii CBS 393.64]|uniref:Autophagy-related protein 2 n=1 Tax=Rasamsonia emersonii (strain ATCC 16479 / CBS 393.64 / IMI 116815) TaxID=1408163 RepID=A0A0F4YZ11_RASE3|nr:Autophagy regulatory protein Atg2 [Rasamsonia emersonii CBS 393.64]KKA23076.1 Autophagy regulatory protein Atg2 [Rasamsonia emersonii CBS 393.64]